KEDLLSDDFLKQFNSGKELNDFLKQIQKRGIEKMLDSLPAPNFEPFLMVVINTLPLILYPEKLFHWQLPPLAPCFQSIQNSRNCLILFYFHVIHLVFKFQARTNLFFIILLLNIIF